MRHTEQLVRRARKIIGSKEKAHMKRHLLNQIEKDNPQLIFIKTHLCVCGRLEAEIWIRV